VLGLIVSLLAPNPFVLGVGIFVIGLATAVFALARHAFMTSHVPASHRARALSTLGGIFRAGFFIGPFITAAAIHFTGSGASAFFIHIVACLAAGLVLLVMPDPTSALKSTRDAATRDTAQPSRPSPDTAAAAPALVTADPLVPGAPETRGLFATIAANRGILARLGTGAALISAMRASRAVILPLWAVSLGISDTNTALIIGIAGAVDFALFYASGQIMDRFGRLATGLPSMIGLGIGHFVLAVTHDLSSAVPWFIAAAVILSVSNGIGSGIIMTLGADLADKRDPAPFLGAWRFTGNLGGAAAPLVVAGLTAVASLSVAAATFGLVGLIGAGVLVRYIPRFVPRKR